MFHRGAVNQSLSVLQSIVLTEQVTHYAETLAKAFDGLLYLV